jgi:hypothetical protein
MKRRSFLKGLIGAVIIGTVLATGPTFVRGSEVARIKAIVEQQSFTDISHFQQMAFPLIRRVYPTLLANDIVSVQPMMGPTGLLFYTDYLFPRPTVWTRLQSWFRRSI